MKPVTDPELLRQLDGAGPKPVTDPAVLEQLGTSAFDRGALALKSGMDKIQSLPVIGGPFRAVRDRAQAVAQIVGNTFGSPEDMRTYETLRADSERQYQQARKDQGDSGHDWDRTLAGIGVDVMLTSRLPGLRHGPAPTLLGRAGQGAVIGGASGALTPVESDRTGADFWRSKGINSALSAGVGGVAPFIAEPVVAAATNAVNKVAGWASGAVRGVAGKISDKNIEFNLAMTLQQQGVDWGKLGSETQRALIMDVRKAMSRGKPITAEQLSRAADFRAIGTQATRGQLSLDPMQIKLEQNLKGVQGVGEPLTRRFEEQNKAVFDSLRSLRQGAGSGADDIFDAGSRVQSALMRANEQGQAKVRDAYSAAKSAAGADAEVPLGPLAQTFGEMRNRLDMSVLPGPVKDRLTALGLMDGKQTKAFTVADADDLIKTINYNYDARNPVQKNALDKLRTAVKESVNAIAESESPAAGAFNVARQTAAQRFAQLEATPALKAARFGDLRPDDLVEKYVLSKAASVDDVKNLIQAAGPQAHSDIKAAVMSHLIRKAQGTSSDAAPQFNYATFKNELDRIGQRKLSQIFNSDEVAALNRLARIGSVMNYSPKSVTINRSGTSQAFIDLMDRVNSVPFVNKLVASPIQSAIRSSQVHGATNAGLAGIPGGLLSEPLRALLAERGGLLGAAAGAPVVSGLLSQ